VFVPHDYLSAIAGRDIPAAERAAQWIAEQDGRPLNLASSLTLLRLYAEDEPTKYEAAALQWLGRLLLEHRPTLLEAQIAVGALLDLRARPERFRLLMRMVARRT
jgi:hypothetical protein